MPIAKFQFKPNINKESTTYAQEGEFRNCDKIRFRSGYPEKIGGWAKLTTNTFLGTCRALWAWTTLAGETLIGVGTNLKYYIERGGGYYDTTPIRRTATLTNPFTTFATTLATTIGATDTTLTLASTMNLAPQGTLLIGSEIVFYGLITGTTLTSVQRGYNGTTAAPHTAGVAVGSNMVMVTDTSHGAVTNDFVTFSGATAVGGIPAAALNLELQAFVNSLDTYYVLVSSYATATATGGGTVTAAYQENTGLDIAGGAVGWGAGGWGSGTWGNSSSTGIGAQLRLWNHANFGENLIFGPRGGNIYYWQASTGFGTRGVFLSSVAGASDVPLFQNQIIVTQARITAAFGTNLIGTATQDPMLIRWSDQENPQIWTPTPTNTAGDYRLSNGSTIVTAVQTRDEILAFTDTALYSMQFVGAPDVFDFKLLADNISIVGPNAVVVSNNIVFWMGRDKFYTYTGRVETLPCSVRQYVFGNMNQNQGYQVYAGNNPGFNEVWFHYPSGDASQNDSYVTWNYVDNAWATGSMNRTAWLYTGTLGYPVAASNNYLVLHEQGFDDGLSTPTAPIYAYIETGDFDLGDGDHFTLVRKIIPDFTFDGSTAVNPTVNITIRPRRSSGSAYRAEENPSVVRAITVPYEQYTEYVYVRARGRQMSIKIESTGLGVTWQLGLLRMDVRPDGRKG